MAEYLIYNRKYDGAYKIGDIVNEREDGFFATESNPKGRGWNKEKFLLLQVPGLVANQELEKPNDNKDGTEMIDKRYYTLTVDATTFEQWETDKEKTVTDTIFTEYLTEKDGDYRLVC